MTEPLYWIALNFLPLPLARVRTLHDRLGGRCDALRQVTSRELSLLSRTGARESSLTSEAPGAAPGAPEAPPADGEADPEAKRNAAMRTGWWDKVHCGGIGYASPLTAAFREGRVGGSELLEEAAREAARAASLGITIVTLSDPGYPPLLACCSAPPPILYLKGTLREPLRNAAGDGAEATPSRWWSGEAQASPLEGGSGAVVLAVVGSRSPTEYGRIAARRLGRAIGASGALLVSGLARGIDAEAHEGALEAGGDTLGVLGGGLAADAVPPSNRRLGRRIERQGALVSEYPLLTQVHTEHFPRRNRIISGLAAATVVVEAALRSGSLITARLALEEGRDVFTVPGRWTDETAAGCNGLLRSSVAGALSRPEDLFEDLAAPWRGRLASPTASSAAPEPEGLTEDERQVYRLLRCDEPRGVDGLIAAAGGSPGRVLAALVSLEIRRLAVSAPGGSYRRGG